MRALAILVLWSATASAEPCNESGHCNWANGLIISFMGSAIVAEHVAIPGLSTSGTAFNATGSAPYHAELAPGLDLAGFNKLVREKDVPPVVVPPGCRHRSRPCLECGGLGSAPPGTTVSRRGGVRGYPERKWLIPEV